jgi:hypothetical protein
MSWLCARATEASVLFQVSAGQPTAARCALVSVSTCCSYEALPAGDVVAALVVAVVAAFVVAFVVVRASVVGAAGVAGGALC